MTLRADDVTKEHVARIALPWRHEAPLTECGLASEMFSVLTYPQFLEKVKTQGQQRAAMSTCMTCWQTADRYQGYWAHQRRSFRQPSLLQVLHREMERLVYHEDKDGGRLRNELFVIAGLIEAHRDEFDQRLKEMGDAVWFNASIKALGSESR